MGKAVKQQNKKKSSDDMGAVQDIFSKTPVQIRKKIESEVMDIEDLKGGEDIDVELEGNGEEEEQQEQNPFVTEELSMKQKQDRDERTIFIGNIPLETNKKEMIKLFKKFGKIENIRERSVPVRPSANMSVKARVILEKHVEGSKDDQVKNCYILYEKKESAEEALEKNGLEFKGNFLRVDLAEKKELDFTKTIFIGNLSFMANENMLRSHFASCGKIVNVRLIRDKITHQGKGFGYVEFENDEGFQNAMELKGSKLNDRELRIKKAVPKARLDKKKAKKDEQRKQNSESALRRIQKSTGKVEQQNDKKRGASNPDKEVINKENKSAIKQFVDGQMDNIANVEYKNNIVIPPRMMRKSIKKSKKRGENETQQFKKAQLTQQKFHERNDRNVFNAKPSLKGRREHREKQRQLNAKKYKKQVINE